MVALKRLLGCGSYCSSNYDSKIWMIMVLINRGLGLIPCEKEIEFDALISIDLRNLC